MVSGRRASARVATTIPKAKPKTPVLQETLDSCRRATAWCFAAVSSGRIKETQHRALDKAIRTMQANIKIREQLHEMEKLKQLVARQEAAARLVRQAEIDSRKTGGDDVSEYDAEPAPGTN